VRVLQPRQALRERLVEAAARGDGQPGYSRKQWTLGTHQTVSVSRYRRRYATTSLRVSAVLRPSSARAAIEVCAGPVMSGTGAELILSEAASTHHGERVRLEDGGLVLPLVGDAQRDGQALLGHEELRTAGSFERALVQKDGVVACVVGIVSAPEARWRARGAMKAGAYPRESRVRPSSRSAASASRPLCAGSSESARPGHP